MTERKQIWDGIAAVCEQAHLDLDMPMIPWSPSNRILALESIQEGKAIIGVYSPIKECYGRRAGILCLSLDEALEIDSNTLSKLALRESNAYAANLDTISPLPGRSVSENSLNKAVAPMNPKELGSGNGAVSLPLQSEDDEEEIEESIRSVCRKYGVHNDVDYGKCFYRKSDQRISIVLGDGNDWLKKEELKKELEARSDVNHVEFGYESSPNDDQGYTPIEIKEDCGVCEPVPYGKTVDGSDDLGSGEEKKKSKPSLKLELMGSDPSGPINSGTSKPTAEGEDEEPLGESPMISILNVLKRLSEGSAFPKDEEGKVRSSVHGFLNTVLFHGLGHMRKNNLSPDSNHAQKLDKVVSSAGKLHKTHSPEQAKDMAKDLSKRALALHPELVDHPTHKAMIRLSEIAAIDGYNRSTTRAPNTSIPRVDVPESEGVDEATKKYFAAVPIVLKKEESGYTTLMGIAHAPDADYHGKMCWPGGGVDPEDGGDVNLTAERECWEETGINCKSTKAVIDFPDKPGVAFVVCEFVDGDIKANQEFKPNSMKWVSFEKVMYGQVPNLYPANVSVANRVPAFHKAIQASIKEAAIVGGKGAVAGKATGEEDKSAVVRHVSSMKPKEQQVPKGEVTAPKSAGAQPPEEEFGAEQPPKIVALKLSSEQQAKEAFAWLRSVGIEGATIDINSINIEVVDATDMEIINRTASAYGLALADVR